MALVVSVVLGRVGRVGQLLLLLLSGSVVGAQEPAYKDPRLSIDERVRDLLGRMTVEEKFWQLYMIPGAIGDSGHDYSKGIFGLQTRTALTARADAELHNRMQRWLRDSTRLGIPMIPFEEAVHGVMRHGATVFPAAIGLAATFDTALMQRVSHAIAREASSRGIRQALSPVVNIANDVRWGRVEETYGEDPYLSSVFGRVFVREMERSGIIATPKHFVANVGDGGRDSYPIDISARALEEMHFPPFRATIREAGARSIMTSYNSIDGSPASQNAALLNGTLKRDWGFRGFVISDQAAVGGATVLHFTEPNTPAATKHALESGLDVVFQSSWPQHRNYLLPFTRGEIADSVIDAAVARVLRAKVQLGLFENPFVNADSAAAANRSAAHRTLAREAARSSMVLLKNASGALPLRRGMRLAVFGPDAVEHRLGGYTLDSAPAVSLVEALRVRGMTVRYAAGPPRVAAWRVAVPASQLESLKGEYWANNRFEGAPTITRNDPSIDFRWTLSSPGRGIPFDWYSVRWTGKLKVPAGGAGVLGVEGNDGYRLWLDGKLIVDNWTKKSFGSRVAPVTLAPNSVHDIRLDYFESTGNARVKLVWDAGQRRGPTEPMGQFSRDIAIVRESDAAVVMAGIEEGEFRDRARLSLSAGQESLIRAVAATGKPTIIVLVGGSAIAMSPWIDAADAADAVLQAWYSGEEGGNAIADVLFGDYNPAGRLPITFPVSEGQLPLVYNHKPTGRGDDYVDLTGMAAFPFGFGLSYTTFEYSDLRIDGDTIATDGATTVRFRVTNTGTRAGEEVPQLYVRDVLASVARPMMELKGFTRVALAPGETRDVAMRLRAKDLEFLDANMRWVVEPGTWRVMVGASSKDIRLRGALVVR